jgi:hypothetical protein
LAKKKGLRASLEHLPSHLWRPIRTANRANPHRALLKNLDGQEGSIGTENGVEAGNLALKCLPTRVFVGGGIAPKILPILQNGSFLRGFTDKGRFAALMKTVEVSVALNPAAPLIGAAYYALKM